MHTTFANRLPHTQDVGVGRTLPIGGTVDLDENDLTEYQFALIEDGALVEVDEPAEDLHLDFRAPETDPEPVAPPTPAAPKARAKPGGATPGGSVAGDEDGDKDGEKAGS